MMSWNSLPLIEMDEVHFEKERTKPKDYARSQGRETGAIEKDISKQLSALRGQSGTSRDDRRDKPMVDEFGRDIGRADPRKGDLREDLGSRRRERSRSPRRWRDDDDRGRDRNQGRDWGRDESRRRGRDDYRSDGSNESWEGGRNGDRCRDWPRDRESERYQDRRDWDSRDRDDRDWRRDRWDGRDDDRRPDYRDRYRNNDDRYWSEHRSRDRYHDDRDYQRRDYREEPSEIVMLKGLPTSIDDAQIHEILANAKLPYKDVRVVKTREGFSKGFAFVEFLDMETAKKWIDDCKGKLVIEDFTVFMAFSRSKTAVEQHRDWVCSKCNTQNFSSKRRNTCFTCNAPKDDNDEMIQMKELGATPCKVLILRGLDILTTEETIRQSLTSFTSTPIFDVRLIKDKLTGTSRGFCFVEFGSIEEATQLMEELQSASFKIDEKLLVVSYAKFGTNPSKSGNVAVGSSSSSTSTTVSETSTSSTTTQSRSSNNFAANAIAQARAAAQMGHTTDPVAGSMEYYSTEATDTATQSAPVTVQDPAVTSGVPSEASSVTTVKKPAPTPGAPQAISSYVYDAASGYYYDTTTGLYYDPTTQYYYNGTTQQYMYWDATTQQYVTVVSSASETPAATTGDPTPPASTSEVENAAALSKEKQKKAKSLNAKKIAKDMERWAKKQAKTKDTARPQATMQATADAVKESTYQYDPNGLKGGIKMSLSGSSALTSLALTSSPLAALSELDDPTPTVPTATGSLVPEYGGDDSGGEEDNSKEDDFTDLSKMACLLCKRQFPSKETLTRHVQLSDLHKQNMLVQKKLKMSFSQIDDYEREQREAKYRDRARERRELFGQPDSAPPGKRKKKGKMVYEQPTKDGITSDNIGNKMLQAMGWTAGTGLGRERQGIVDPIMAKMRNRTAGLGLKGSDYGGTAGDSERDLLKKMAQSRYDD